MSSHDERTLVYGTMVRRAEHDEVSGVVTATLGAPLERCARWCRVPAPGDGTAALFAAENVAAESWRIVCAARW
jgi:hypothetical protein